MLTSHQLAILQHAIGADHFGQVRGARNFFGTEAKSADGVVCQELVAMGLMTDCGTVAWAECETVYRVTEAGRAAVKQHSQRPTMTRSQRRYQAYLDEDSGLTFTEWLACQKHRVTK